MIKCGVITSIIRDITQIIKHIPLFMCTNISGLQMEADQVLKGTVEVCDFQRII